MFYAFIWLPEKLRKHFIGPYYGLKKEKNPVEKKKNGLKYRPVAFNFFLLIHHL